RTCLTLLTRQPSGMAGWRVDMDLKLAAIVVRQAALAQQPEGRIGQALSVVAICAELEISRETYYVAARRYEAEGLTGLLPRSRRPLHSPNRISAKLEDQVLA